MHISLFGPNRTTTYTHLCVANTITGTINHASASTHYSNHTVRPYHGHILICHRTLAAFFTPLFHNFCASHTLHSISNGSFSMFSYPFLITIHSYISKWYLIYSLHSKSWRVMGQCDSTTVGSSWRRLVYKLLSSVQHWGERGDVSMSYLHIISTWSFSAYSHHPTIFLVPAELSELY